MAEWRWRLAGFTVRFDGFLRGQNGSQVLGVGCPLASCAPMEHIHQASDRKVRLHHLRSGQRFEFLVERRSGAVLLSTPRAPFQRALETPGREGEVGGWSSPRFSAKNSWKLEIGNHVSQDECYKRLVRQKGAQLVWKALTQFSEALKNNRAPLCLCLSLSLSYCPEN